MVNPTLRSPRPSLSPPLPPQDDPQSCALVTNRPSSFNHQALLTLLAAITPVMVLVNCLNEIRGAFVAVPIQTTLAIVQPFHSAPDYLGVYAKVLWAYAPPGHLAQPARCQAEVSP